MFHPANRVCSQRLTRLRAFGLFGALACAGAPRVATADDASAQAGSAGDKPAYENMSLEELLQVPVIVTASREEEAATEAPATTVVISRDEIRLRGYSFLKDVLRDLPGMETKEYQYALAGSTQVPVRGVVGNNKILILVNGMRVNPPGGEPLTLASDVSVRDAEQIEIVYGPGSTLYGQDAISAVINIITRKPGDAKLPISRREARDRFLGFTPDSRRLATVGIEFGYPLQKEVWGSLNLRFGEVRIYGSVHYLDKELTDLSSAYPEFWSRQEQVAMGRGLSLDPKRFDRGLNVMFRADYGNTSVQVWHRRSARFAPEGFGLFGFYVEGSRWQDASTVFEGRNVLSIGRYLSLESLLTINYFELDPSSRFYNPSPPIPGQPLTWLVDPTYGRALSGALSERLTFRLDKRLTIVAGLFAAHYDVTPRSTVPGGADLDRSVAAEAGTITYYTRQGDATSRVDVARVNPTAYQNIGGYLEGNWRIFRMLRLILGMRIDKNTAVDDLAFSPRAALIFNYESFTAKYIFARAFVAPPPSDKFLIYQVGGAIHGSNPGLAPETATSNELNLSFHHRHFNIGTSFYYNLQENLIFQSGIPGNFVGRVWLDPQGRRPGFLSQTANGGSSTAMGVDFFGKFNIWKLSGWGSYSFTSFNANVDGEDLAPAGFSTHNFRLGVTFSILKNLHATASAIVKSTPVNLAWPELLDGLIAQPWELNAHLLYSPIPSVDLYADFRNLTNHKYYLADGVTGVGPYPIQAFQGSGGLRLTF